MTAVEHERVRDGLLAGGVLAVLVSILRTDGDLAILRDGQAAGSGIAVALLVEGAFLRYPETLQSWWERPVVNRGSALGLCGGAVLARRHPRLVSAAIWGLVTYFGLLLWVSVRPAGSHRDA